MIKYCTNFAQLNSNFENKSRNHSLTFHYQANNQNRCLINFTPNYYQTSHLKLRGVYIGSIGGVN